MFEWLTTFPIAGDWNGDRRDGIGAVYRQFMEFHLRNSLSEGPIEIPPFRHGGANCVPIVGDWDGHGRDGIGIVVLNTMEFHLRNDLSEGPVQIPPFKHGTGNVLPIPRGVGNVFLIHAPVNPFLGSGVISHAEPAVNKDGKDDWIVKVIVEALKVLAGWIGAFNYESIGGACPACQHPPVHQRHVGFVIGGHDQQSCPCRLIRQGGRPHPCGCEWTQDL